MHRAYLLLCWCLYLCSLASWSWALEVTSGSYTGNGTDNTDITMSGCTTPVAVFVIRNTTGRDMFVRLASHGTNESSHVTAAGVVITDGIKSFGTGTFRLGINANVNNTGSTHYYTALCDNGQNDIATLTWTGDGTDNKNQSFSPAFTPEFAFVLPATANDRTWRGATSHSGDSASFTSASLADSADYIQSFGSGSIQVGTSNNVGSRTYYALVVKASSGAATGSFTGNGADNQDITATANPEFIWIKGNSVTQQLAYRMGVETGDNSFCDVSPDTTDIIQAVSGTGFQVGTSTCANENTVAMRWAAFADFSSSAFGVLRRRTE